MEFFDAVMIDTENDDLGIISYSPKTVKEGWLAKHNLVWKNGNVPLNLPSDTLFTGQTGQGHPSEVDLNILQPTETVKQIPELKSKGIITDTNIDGKVIELKGNGRVARLRNSLHTGEPILQAAAIEVAKDCQPDLRSQIPESRLISFLVYPLQFLEKVLYTAVIVR